LRLCAPHPPAKPGIGIDLKDVIGMEQQMQAANARTAPAALDDYALARRAMIDSQLRPSGVNKDAVRAAIRAVPREEHVPASARGFAYMDRAIRVENGRFLPAPLVHGMMLEEATPTAADNALVVDAGSGYLSALVGQLAGTCHTISIEDALGKGKKPSDITWLAVDGAIEELPATLVKLLADDARVIAGRLDGSITRLALGRKSGKDIAWLNLGEMGIPVLPEFAAAKSWSF
jgi:protein-L-isoaspartate(D-aspartate) O-methyltransferase